MTLQSFDPRLLGGYAVAPPLLHFQWGDVSDVCRYVLVDRIPIGDIDERTKLRKNEVSQEAIRSDFMKGKP